MTKWYRFSIYSTIISRNASIYTLHFLEWLFRCVAIRSFVSDWRWIELQFGEIQDISSSARPLSRHDLHSLPDERGKFNSKIQVLSRHPQSPFPSAALNRNFTYGTPFDLYDLLQRKMTLDCFCLDNGNIFSHAEIVRECPLK